MTNERRWTDGRELGAYLGLHLLALLIAFTVFPKIFAALMKAGQTDMIMMVSVALHVTSMVVVLVLFLIIRRALHGNGRVVTDGPARAYSLSAAASPQPGPSVKTQGAALGSDMTSAMPSTGYVILRNGTHVVFRYKKARYGFGAGFAFGFVALFIAPLVGMFFGLTAGLLTPFVLGIGLPLLLNLSRWEKGEFAVSDHHLHVDGRSYDRNLVSRIFIPQGRSANVSHGSVVIVGTGLQGAAMAASHGVSKVSEAAGAVAVQVVQRASSGVKFTYGEKDFWLASKVRPKRAEAIFFDLSKVLDGR